MDGMRLIPLETVLETARDLGHITTEDIEALNNSLDSKPEEKTYILLNFCKG